MNCTCTVEVMCEECEGFWKSLNMEFPPPLPREEC